MINQGSKGYHYKILSSTNFTSVACGYYTNNNITINTNNTNSNNNITNNVRKIKPDE